MLKTLKNSTEREASEIWAILRKIDNEKKFSFFLNFREKKFSIQNKKNWGK